MYRSALNTGEDRWQTANESANTTVHQQGSI